MAAYNSSVGRDERDNERETTMSDQKWHELWRRLRESPLYARNEWLAVDRMQRWMIRR